jgi:hypothetical protein
MLVGSSDWKTLFHHLEESGKAGARATPERHLDRADIFSPSKAYDTQPPTHMASFDGILDSIMRAQPVISLRSFPHESLLLSSGF